MTSELDAATLKHIIKTVKSLGSTKSQKESVEKRPTTGRMSVGGKNIKIATSVAEQANSKLLEKRKARNLRAKELRLLKKKASADITSQ